MANGKPEWGIVPFDEWLAQKPRSPSEIEIYHSTIDALKRLGCIDGDGKVTKPMANRLTRERAGVRRMRA